MKVGDVVRVKPVEGVRAKGRKARVVKISEHIPVDGPREYTVIVTLSDGTWEFIWNLEVVR